MEESVPTPKAAKPLGFYIGNILIVLALCLLVFIYYPLLSFYLPLPISNQALANVDFSITIPKINAAAPIVDNVDPWNETEYKAALKNGVAKAKGFANFGEGGTVFLFAHSSDYPWNMTRQNTAFLRLSELQTGDTIQIYQNGQTFIYTVYDRKEIWPNEVAALQQGEGDKLVLQTCTPVGTSLKRLLIYAKVQ